MTFHSEESSLSDEPRDSGAPQARKSIKTAPCSYCGNDFDLSVKSFPFCSSRCQQIDLGNWLNEGYGLPVESGEYIATDDEMDD